MRSVDNRALRGDYFDRFHQTGAGRNVPADQTAENIRHGRSGNCFHGVDRAGNLRRRASEINARAIAFDRHAHANGNLVRADAIIVERVNGFVTAIRNRKNCVTHHPRRIGNQVRRVLARLFRSATFDNFKQTRRAGFERADLCFEIRAALVAAAHVGENQFHHVSAQLAAAHNANWRNAHALTVDVGRQTHRSRCRAADVGVMSAVGNEEKRTGDRRRTTGEPLFPCRLRSAVTGPFREDPRHQRHIRQVRAAGKWIVQPDYVTRADLNVAQRRRHRHRH